MSRQLVPLAKAPEYQIPVSRSGLEWIAFHRQFNGAAKAGAVVKFGGRLYVDPPKFLDWMATQPRISPPVKHEAARTKRRKSAAA